MITGGSPVGFWGHIRTTMDIDILIQIHDEQIDSFLRNIEHDVFIDIEETKKAILDKNMFNIILNKTCLKLTLFQ